MMILYLAWVAFAAYLNAGIACFHFLFGYVHPFYDGSSRLNHFLHNAFLQKSPGLPAALSLSHALLVKRQQYYRVFEKCENPINFSDLTVFAVFFLQTLEEGLDQNICNLPTRIEYSDQLPGES